MARGLFAVLEDELSVIVPGVTNEQAERVEELEEQVAQSEVVEADLEVAESNDTIEEAVTAIEELTDLAEVAEGSIEEGEGLSEDAAEIAEVAVEAICARLGYKPAKKVIPALESFGGASSRLDATKYALEGIKETIAKIWEAVKNFFKGIWTKIVALWKQLFDAATKVQARATTLNKKIDEAVKANLVAGDKVLNLVKYCVAFNAKSEAELEKAIKVVLGRHNDAVKVQAAYNADLVGLFEEVSKAEKLEDFGDKVQAALSKELPAEQLAFGYQVKAENGVVTVTQTKTKVEKAEGKAVALADLKTVVGDANSVAKQISDAKGSFGKAEEVVKKAVSMADKLAKAKDSTELAKEKAKAFRSAQAGFVVTNTKLPSIGLKASSVALDYVSANLGAYKVAEAAK